MLATAFVASAASVVQADHPDGRSCSDPIDPVPFFESLVDRYHQLDQYHDSTHAVHVTRRSGEEPKRLETQMTCEMEAGELKISTPASQIREGLGLTLPFKQSDEMKQQQLQYRLWMAPHMSLRFADDPLADFRPGVEGGFTPTRVRRVTVNEKPMMQVELKSGDGLSEDCAARFDLYVNPESMLVERIEGQERLPDGGNLQTTFEIMPGDFCDVPAPEQGDPVAEHCEVDK